MGESEKEHQKYLRRLYTRIESIADRLDPDFYETNDDMIADMVRDLLEKEDELEEILSKFPRIPIKKKGRRFNYVQMLQKKERPTRSRNANRVYN